MSIFDYLIVFSMNIRKTISPIKNEKVIFHIEVLLFFCLLL